MPKEIITIYGDKKEVRDIEKGHIPWQSNLHVRGLDLDNPQGG
jgi:hypothetical protein